MLIIIGLVLLLPPLQARVAVAAGPIGQWTDDHFGRISRGGVGGQFALGVLLGVVWSPCVGPTLGAASALAAEGRDLAQVATTMVLFGLGAAVPLLVVGSVSRDLLLRWRGRMLSTGKGLRTALGALLIAGGILILSGLDHRVEFGARRGLSALADRADDELLTWHRTVPGPEKPCLRACWWNWSPANVGGSAATAVCRRAIQVGLTLPQDAGTSVPEF